MKKKERKKVALVVDQEIEFNFTFRIDMPFTSSLRFFTLAESKRGRENSFSLQEVLTQTGEVSATSDNW